jgi:F0F1-type ATP synthase membrane subunit a
VVVAIVMSLMFWTAYLLPIPFLALATIGGVAQAFVFCFLTIISFSSHVNNASGGAH